MSTYTTNIPLSAQKIKNTTSLIRANFDNLAAGLSNDHANINDPTSGTRLTHDKVRLNKQTLDPSTTTTQVALYSKDVTTNSVAIPELFFKRAGVGGSAIQMSSGGLTPALSGDLINTQGYTFLPGGLVYVWGRQQFLNDTDITLTVNSIPATKIWSISMQVVFTSRPLGNTASIVLVENINNSVNPATFKVRYLQSLVATPGSFDNAAAVPVFYQAIVQIS